MLRLRSLALLTLLSAAILLPAQITPPKPTTLTFSITLSPAATARLAHGEGLVLSASLDAEPTPAARRHANQIGRIDLLQQQREIPGRPGPPPSASPPPTSPSAGPVAPFTSTSTSSPPATPPPTTLSPATSSTDPSPMPSPSSSFPSTAPSSPKTSPPAPFTSLFLPRPAAR